MLNNEDMDKSVYTESRGHTGLFAGLVAGLVLALAGDAYLIVKSNHLNDRLVQMQESTQGQIEKLGSATHTLLEQRLESINASVRDAHDAADSAMKQAKSEAQRQAGQLARRLDEQQKQVSSELVQLKDSTTNKFNEVATDVSGVKTDVTGVKTDVTSVRADLTTAQSELAKHGSDLKQVMGDMGVMSGLIATNGKELAALRDLGERNYYEFTLRKDQKTRKVGDVVLELKKADPKHNRYSLNIQADDKLVEKKDRTINEPVQIYVSDARQPYEVVINQVKKDELVGYLSTPKVKLARR